MTTTTEPRIYVACLASYNNGVLHGAWIDATSDVDAMQSEVDAMLRASKFPNVTVPCPDCDGTGKKTFHNSETGDTREGDCPHCLGKGEVPSAEEFAIHDSEGLGDIGEYAGLSEVARRVEIIEAADDRDIPPAVLLEAMSDAGADDAESFIDDKYDGTAESWLAFVLDRADDMGMNSDELPEWVRNYVDWDSMARDWQISGDWSAYGQPGELYFFRNA